MSNICFNENGDYLVAKAVILVRGVLKNKETGYLLITDDVLERTASKWEGVMLSFNHPHTLFMNGADKESFYIGDFKDSYYEDGKIKGEFWIDKKKLDNHEDYISYIIKNGVKIDISSGFKINKLDHKEGEYDGVKYRAILEDYEADHIALLSHTKGVCSVEDGCGLNVMNSMCDCEKCRKGDVKMGVLSAFKKAKDKTKSKKDNEMIGALQDVMNSNEFSDISLEKYDGSNCVFNSSGKTFSVEYEEEGDTIRFNEPVEVVKSYVPVEGEESMNAKKGMMMNKATTSKYSDKRMYEEDDSMNAMKMYDSMNASMKKKTMAYMNAMKSGKEMMNSSPNVADTLLETLNNCDPSVRSSLEPIIKERVQSYKDNVSKVAMNSQVPTHELNTLSEPTMEKLASLIKSDKHENNVSMNSVIKTDGIEIKEEDLAYGFDLSKTEGDK